MEFPALAALAAEQGGLFTWRQAREAGYSPWQIRIRLGDGRWRQLAPRVLGGSGVGDNPSVRDRAAYLAAGQPATLSGPSAARLHGIDVPATFSCVTVPLRRHVEIPGVRVLREPVGADDTMLLADMFVTTKPRTVFDSLRLLPRNEALSLLDRALQKKWITVEGLIGRVRRHGRRKGAPHLRALVEEATLAIEVDGRAWHSADDRFRRDRTRQNRLVNAGWTVLRFTWHDLNTDMPRVIATIRAALARA